MSEIRRCPECRSALTADAPGGLCARCLLSAGLEETDDVNAATFVSADFEESAVSAGVRVRYFGDYELLDEIARGGMGVVYRARQTSLNRVVALKMILTGQLASEEDVRRFQTEAEAAARLQHPNIVAVHEVGQHAGQHFFSMDYVDGRSLSDIIQHQPLSPVKSADYICTIAEAIHYAHEQGIVHRDLKPANILIDGSDQPRITDFGLARQIEDDPRLTTTGTVMGTPGYMAPEQAAAQPEQIGRPTDVYSLGAVLYALLTGRPPFQAASVLDTLNQVREQEPVSPRSLNSVIPLDLETICLKCLEKRPENRYQTAQELADDLNRYLRQEPIEARPAGAIRTLWSSAKRRPWQFAGVGAILLAGFLGYAYYLRAENSFLKWTAAHPDYVKTPGTYTTRFEFSIYLCLGVIVCLQLAQRMMILITGISDRSLSIVKRHSMEYRLRGQPFPGSLLRLYGFLGASCVALGVCAVTNAIDAHIWENHGTLSVFLTLTLCVLGIGVSIRLFVAGPFLCPLLHLDPQGVVRNSFSKLPMNVWKLFFWTFLGCWCFAVWFFCLWFVFTESRGSLDWCINYVMGEAGPVELTSSDMFMQGDAFRLLVVWWCIKTGGTLLIEVLREYESCSVGSGATFSSALSEVDFQKVRKLLLDGQKSAAINAYIIATEVPLDEAQIAIGDFEVQLFRAHPDKAPVGGQFVFFKLQNYFMGIVILCSVSMMGGLERYFTSFPWSVIISVVVFAALWRNAATFMNTGAVRFLVLFSVIGLTSFFLNALNVLNVSPRGTLLALLSYVTVRATVCVCERRNWGQDRRLNLIFIILVIGSLVMCLLPASDSGIVIGWIIGGYLGLSIPPLLAFLRLMNQAAKGEPNPYAPDDRRHYLYYSLTPARQYPEFIRSRVPGPAVAAPVKSFIVPEDADGGSQAPGSDKSGQNEFDVLLTGMWNQRDAVARTVGDITGLSIEDAQELTSHLPQPLKEGIPKCEAEQLKAAVEAAGGFCEIKPVDRTP
jgi:ribosomal protein L7/L12/predicted Ser/Thr protein kinase